MEENITRETRISNKMVAKSLFLKFMERCGSQLSSFIISMILARILLPEDYGVLSILLIFITISQVFVQSGLGMALIQKKDADNKDFSAVFYVSLIIAVVIYTILFFLSPFVAIFFEMKDLTDTLRVISISLFMGAFSSILNSILVKKMQFGKLLVANMSGSILSGVAGVVLAINGFGIWSLVWQYIFNQFIALCLMEFFCKWFPCGFSCLSRIKPLFNYGYKILISNLISTTYNELRGVLIGKKYTPSTLAYYDKGKQFPHLIISNLDQTINNVMFPVYSGSKDDVVKIKELLRKSMQISTYLISPLIFGMCAIAYPLVVVLLTEKWVNCVPFLIFNALIYLLSPIQTANAQVINAIGRSDVTMKLEIVKKVLGTIVLILSIVLFDDVIYVVYGGLIIAILSSLINMFPNRKLINYSYKEQFLDILPNLFISMIMYIVVYSMSYIIKNLYILLLVQIFVGISVYIGLSYITRNKSFKFVLNLLKKKK